MTIDRYYPDADSFGNYHGMERAKFGEWVLYKDHDARFTVLSRQEHEIANRLDNANARIAELTARNTELEAEVGKLRSAMQSIVDDYKQGFRTDWTTAANYADIARNALREG
jgi:cell division protein FtsB